MNRGILLLSLAVLVCSSAQSQEPHQYDLIGFVTRAASGSDFDVNGIHILCGKRTTVVQTSFPDITIKGCPPNTPYIGEPFKIDGSIKAHTLAATHLEIAHPQFVDGSGAALEMSGSAVIDSLPAQDSVTAGELVVLADGYSILITSKTALMGSPLPSFADVRPGAWIEYKGVRHPDGVMVAKEAKIMPNDVNHGEEKLRTKTDYDPAKVPADSKQSELSKDFFGIDPKKIPPYPDAAMQARITEIGRKLVPAYQRALPDSNPAKINFRFQLIDGKKWQDALTLPSGVILVPHEVVERMQNDSQLAAVLADNIACALEKQRFRMQTEVHALEVVSYGSILVPIAGPAVDIGAGVREHDLLVKARQQSGRVSLGLLHDAGFDIDEAPKAWWLLASAKPKPLAEISLPERASYLYEVLGNTWHNPFLDATAPNR